jgi:hypothetical protein
MDWAGVWDVTNLWDKCVIHRIISAPGRLFHHAGRLRRLAEERAAATSRPTTNGNLPPVGMEATSEAGNIIPDNERAWLNETAAAARTAQGMAFLAAERLHLGMLGQLQYAREQGGEEAVDREIKRLMGGSSKRERLLPKQRLNRKP